MLHAVRDNHSARCDWRAAEPFSTTRLVLRIHATHGAPAAVLRVRAFAG